MREDKKFDSKVFIEIPQVEIIDSSKYRSWMLKKEMQWMTEFNYRNKNYSLWQFWNKEEGGMHGYFGEKEINNCKLYRFDGTLVSMGENDFRSKRGYLIRDHYSEEDVRKVHFISDNLVNFLEKEKIDFERINLRRQF